jgi:hypothetical protein
MDESTGRKIEIYRTEMNVVQSTDSELSPTGGFYENDYYPPRSIKSGNC